MTIQSLGAPTAEEKWVELPVANTTYWPYFIKENFASKQVVLKVFAKDGTTTPTTIINFLDSSLSSISSKSFSGSYAYFTIPVGTVSITIGANTPVAVSFKFENVSVKPTLNAVKYTTSQSITLTKSYSFVLMGGGGAGGGSPASSGSFCKGGGSGYITTGTIGAGTYSLVIGAGGAGSSTVSTGATGGTSTFSTFSAAGGQGGTNQGAGANGGSGGSGSSGNGGTNGGNGTGNLPGTGSGVSLPTTFSLIPGAGGVVGTGGTGGGLYAGGGGSNGSGSGSNGGNATGTGGGGGGSTNGSTNTARTGGSGAAGALYLLEIG